jgi:predicted nucleic acid-binding protein
MAEPPVTNTSPLTILTGSGRLDLLGLAGEPVLVPATVADEVAAYGPDDPTVRAIAEADWLVIVETPPISHRLQALDLGPGETAALAWALTHPGTTVIMDDDRARRAVKALGVPVVGTLGLILAAKEQGVIAEAAPLIERARRAGLYLSERLVQNSLRRAGE